MLRQTLISLATLAIHFAPTLAHAANTCDGNLIDRIEMPSGLTRLSLVAPLKNLHEVLSRTLADHPALVLTREGEDVLLVIDARRAVEIGPEKFLRDVLKREMETPTTERWISAVGARFERYAEDTLKVNPLALVSKDLEALAVIEHSVLLRFFEHSARGQNVAIISLNARSSSTTAVTPRPAPVALSGATGSRRSPSFPATLWFQLPIKNKPRIVTWDIDAAKRPVKMRFAGEFERGYDDLMRYASGPTFYFPLLRGPRTAIVDAIETAGFIYKIEVIEEAEYTRFSIRAAIPATASEILFLQSDVVQNQLEPAETEINPFGEIRIPSRLKRIKSEMQRSFGSSLGRLIPSEAKSIWTKLAELPKGHLKRIDFEPVVRRIAGSDGQARELLFYTQTFVFFRADNDKLYLTGRVEWKPTDK